MTRPLLVIGVFAAGQALDAGFLSPNIVGSKIGLHPVWLIFALFAFSYLFGFVGTLVAVPVAAALAVLIRFALTAYLQSPVYRASRIPPQPRLAGRPERPFHERQSQSGAAAASARAAAQGSAGRRGFSRQQLQCGRRRYRRCLARLGHPAIGVIGPRGAGKSHLANVWRLRSGAHVIAASELRRAGALRLREPRRARRRGYRPRHRRRADPFPPAQSGA